jgi:hypothetical protein
MNGFTVACDGCPRKFRVVDLDKVGERHAFMVIRKSHTGVVRGAIPITDWVRGI